MANVSANNANLIEFKNLIDGVKPDEAPTLTLQVGDWNNGKYVESGVTFDVTGDQTPLLSANDVRKLAKWLLRAAEELDGKKNKDSKKQPRYRDDEDDDNYYIK